MTSNRFIYWILAAFIAGNVLIIFIQYNSAKNIHNLIMGNKKLLHELTVENQLRELERDLLSSELKMDRTVATGDTSQMKEVDQQLNEARGLLDSLRAVTGPDSTLRHIERLTALDDEKSKLRAQILDSFRITGKLSIESFRAMTRQRPLVNDVNNASRTIYEIRQRQLDSLSAAMNSSGRKAQSWSAVLILTVLASGAVLFWYIINRIRRQNELILQLDASERKVREVSLIKEKFMANISHEIRTPMNAILGFANLLKTRNRDPDSKEFVDAIWQSGQNLLTIINDLLDLSKIEAGMMRMESVPFNIREVIRTVQTMFAETISEKGLHFSAVVDDSIPGVLSGDSTRLTQILANVVGNAVKFTASGSIQVEVGNQGLEGDHVLLGFVISDTGIGIAPEKISGIFERFRQAEDSTTRKYGGTGLGLSIVKDLVSLLHGTIAVESEPGKGTVFSITIPYAIAPATLEARAPLEEDLDARHIRILVVEDNKLNQTLLRHLLTAWKFSWEMVDNGMGAIEKLETGSYDLVLMDIQMPGMDGYEAARQIRLQLKLSIPIIAMTAHAFAGELEKCLSYGMNDCIAKPIDQQELHRLIIKHTRPYQFIDLEYMQGISGGNKEYERSVTEQFLEVIPLDIDTLESALSAGDPDRIRHTAHSMRSDVAILGLLDKLQTYLDVLEYEPFDETVFRRVISEVKTICLGALPEARHLLSSVL